MSEELYQVLYVKDGDETLTDAEPYEDAQARAEKMDKDGYHVLSVMTVDGAKRHMAEQARRAEESGKSPFFPIQQYLKANRDVEAEVDDSLETGDEDWCVQYMRLGENRRRNTRPMTRKDAYSLAKTLEESGYLGVMVVRATEGEKKAVLDREKTRRSADRRLAVDYALRMYEGEGDSRNAEELVKDATTILEFLES
jgi:hypothetical protein